MCADNDITFEVEAAQEKENENVDEDGVRWGTRCGREEGIGSW